MSVRQAWTASLRKHRATLALLLWVVSAPFLLFPSSFPELTVVALVSVVSLSLWSLRLRRWAPWDGLLAAILVLSAVAFLLSPAQADSLRRLTMLAAGASVYLVLGSWLPGARHRARQLAGLLGLAGGPVALFGIYYLDWPERAVFGLERFVAWLPHAESGFLIHHNQLAGALVTLLPLTLAATRRWRGIWRLALGLAAIAMLLALLLVQSRNAYLALFVAAAFRLAWGRIGIRSVAVAIATVAVLPFAMLAFRSEVRTPITSWIAALDEVSKSGPSADESWLIRLELWDAATDMMLDYPAVGAGLYAFEASSRINYPYRLARPTFAFSHAHNGFLQVGVSLGWGGWLALSALWVVVLHSLRDVGKAGQREELWLPPALSASFVAMLVFNTFDVLALEQRAGLMVWLLLALTATVAAPMRLARRLWWVPVALAVVLLVPAGSTNLARLRLDRARLSDAPLPTPQALADDPRRLGVLHFLAGDLVGAREAWRQDSEAVSYLAAQGRWAMVGAADPAAAIAWYTEALAFDAAATEAYLGRGEAYEALGATRKAMADYQAAADYAQVGTPGGDLLAAMAWERQGRLYAQWSEWEAAANAFTLAAELVPEHIDYRQQLQDVLELLAP